MFCGSKQYSTGYNWLTVVVPADPATQNFKLQIATNDYTLASTYTVNLVVSFINSAYTATLTETFSLTLLHPCKITVITPSQLSTTINFIFGFPAVSITFSNF